MNHLINATGPVPSSSVSFVLLIFIALAAVYGVFKYLASWLWRSIVTVLAICAITIASLAIANNGNLTIPGFNSGSVVNVASDHSTKAITNDLIKLTDRDSSGPTKNYYYEAGQAQIGDFSDIDPGVVKFSHDAQGRPSVAKGKLLYDMWLESRGSRQGIPLNPSNGTWPKFNPKVAINFALTGRTYHGYMFNRSHSIADSLAGSNSYLSSDNFTTGTRSQNVGANQNGGMRAAEEYVEDFWKANPKAKNNLNIYVDYRVTPIYNDSEKLPRGSIVDVKSSNGELNKRFVIINSAEGYHINYATGAVTSLS